LGREESPVTDANEKTVERFYHELWNTWDLSVANDVLAEDVRFSRST
jgi:hypothetical protein